MSLARTLNRGLVIAEIDLITTDRVTVIDVDSQPVRKQSNPDTIRWAWIFAGVMFVVYLAFGLWMIYGAGYAIGDAVARASAARSIAHSRDQHLMAVGFYWMPWPTYAEVPFMAVFSRLGIQEWAMVMPTAIAGALTIPVLARIGRDLGVARKWTVGLVVLFAVNPYTIFFSANGMSEIWLGLFLAGASGAYLRWTRHRQVRDVGHLGMWLAMAQLSRYESVVFVLIFAAAVGWQSQKGRRAASLLATALPGLFVLLVWTLVSFIIIKESWWRVVQAAAPPDKIVVLRDGHTLPNVLRYATRLSVRVAPGVAIAALLAGFPKELLGQLRRRDRASLRAVPLIAMGAFFPAQVVFFLLGYRSYGDARYFTPLVLMFTLLALLALTTGKSALKGPLLIALGVLSWFSCAWTISDPRASAVTGEPAVVRKLLGRDLSGINYLDINAWRKEASAIDAYIGPGDVLVLDSSRSQVLHFLSDKPQQIATDRDKSSERLLARAKTDFTLAVLNVFDDENPYAASQQTASIADLLTRSPAGKKWEEVTGLPKVGIVFGNTRLWRLVDDASAPAQVGSDTTSVPVTTRAGTSTTSRPPPSTTPVATVGADEPYEPSAQQRED